MWHYIVFSFLAAGLWYLCLSYVLPIYSNLKMPRGPRRKDPKQPADDITNKKQSSGSSTNSQKPQDIVLRGLAEQVDKTHPTVLANGEQRYTFEHNLPAPVPLPALPVAQFRQKNVKTSVMHGKSIWDVLFIPGLRKFIQPSIGDSRKVQVIYLCAIDNPLFHIPGSYLLISICKKPSVLPAEESHPRNLCILLNDQMIQGIVPNGAKPYPQIPLEVPISVLQAKNVMQIYWLESTAEESAVQDYCLYIYIAERKSVTALVASIETNLLSVAESLAREYDRGKDSNIMAGPRTLHLNDPISRQRIVLPVRGKHCRHLECFDAASFVSMNFGPAARFLCPLCAQIVLPQDLMVDQFLRGLLRFTARDRIELLQDDEGITVRECAKNVAQPVLKTVGRNKKKTKKPPRYSWQNRTILINDDIDLNESIAILDPTTNIADESVMILE